MPKWGLTEAQLAAQPWGLGPDLLKPSKTITDPVHGDVYVTVLEQLVLDSPPMQRLRRVQQLGTTHLVYPGATQSRLSHALGTLRASQDLLDAVADNRRGPRHTPDLLDEWADEEDSTERGLDGGVTVVDARLAEAIVLARLGALMHDICHVPLGHTIEDDLKVLTPHDRNRRRFDRLWDRLDEHARVAIEEAESLFPDAKFTFKEELELLILSKERSNPTDPNSRVYRTEESSYPFVGDIVGNTICADLIDYLQRDHLYTGLPIALGHRFVDDFYVMGSEHKHYAKRMVVRIARYGHPREDVKTELVKYLRYRYELSERVLNHHTKTAADAMIGKLLEMWSDAAWIEEAEDRYGAVLRRMDRDGDVDTYKRAVAAHDRRRLRPDSTVMVTSTDEKNLQTSRAIAEIDQRVQDRLEAEFTRRSDEGLLEYLVELGKERGGDRYEAVAELAESVLNRRLFKLIGIAKTPADLALAQEKYEKFGKPSQRRQLEEIAAQEADLPHGWQVVVWLPNPDMRLKVARVLVDDGENVAPLERVSPAGDHIVQQHHDLWAVSVYADPEVADDPHVAEAALISLKTDMDIGLVTRDGERVQTRAEALVNLIGNRVGMNDDDRAELRLLVNEEFQAVAAGGRPTFRQMARAVWSIARINGLGGVQGRPPADLW